MTNTHVPETFLGTEQHPGARDLSRYIVHMTRTPEDLGSILTTGQIRVGKRFGLGLYQDQVSAKHQSACFTEMPLTELGRLRSRGKPWGVAFRREFIVGQGGQRVWYVDGNATTHAALKKLMKRAADEKDWDGPVWDLTPFVDLRDPAKYAFDWEREWRVPQGLRFELDDVALVIGLDDTSPLFQEKIEIGAPIYNVANESYSWADGTVPAVGANMDAIENQFHSTYISADEAAFLRDPEGPDGYSWPVTRHETEDALQELLPTAPSRVVDALAGHLNQTSLVWAARLDLKS